MKAVVVAILFAVTVAGCGSNELRTTKQAREFIADVLSGNVGKWDDLAQNAVPSAESAWVKREEIKRLGQRLKQEPEWACGVAKMASDFEDAYGGFEELPLEQRDEVFEFVGISAVPEAVESLFNEVWVLTSFEAAAVIDATCSLDG